MNEDDAKDFALTHLHFPDFDLEPLIAKADRGFVVWHMETPPGVNFQTHKFSFIDAIMRALSFCETNCIDDWAVLGPRALEVVRTLPQYVEKPERSTGKMTFIGTLGAIKLYAWPRAECNKFWAGHGAMCCLGQIDGL